MTGYRQEGFPPGLHRGLPPTEWLAAELGFAQDIGADT